MDRLPFVKGHCGWDTVTVIPLPVRDPAACLTHSLKILDEPICGGLEVGWLSPTSVRNRLELAMVSSTARDWIDMCGGMTQVIGRALVETFLADLFEIDFSTPIFTITLVTPSGSIDVEVEQRNRRFVRARTTMTNYVKQLYQLGIEPLSLSGADILRVGDYFVADTKQLDRAFDLDFTSRRPGPALDRVNQLLRAFATHLGKDNANGMLFDARPEAGGDFRVFPRFYSPDMAASRIPWEFQCGTGSIAVAVALSHLGELDFGERGTTVFEWGSQASLKDPYGCRTSEIGIWLSKGLVTRATFSHSVVEILAEGEITLPTYQL